MRHPKEVMEKKLVKTEEKYPVRHKKDQEKMAPPTLS